MIVHNILTEIGVYYMSATETDGTEVVARTRKPRGPAAEFTPGALAAVLRLSGAERFATYCAENSGNEVFTKALKALVRSKPELAAHLPMPSGGTVSAARGLFVNTAPIGAMPGDSVSVKVEGDAIVIRRA